MKNQNNERKGVQITRRKLIVASGTTLVGATLFGSLFDFEALAKDVKSMSDSELKSRGIMSKNGGMKPTILPQADSKDPVAFSIADNAFWNEQLMEHAMFFVMLMPGPELAAERSQAEQFQRTFAGQLQKSKTANLDRGGNVDALFVVVQSINILALTLTITLDRRSNQTYPYHSICMRALAVKWLQTLFCISRL